MAESENGGPIPKQLIILIIRDNSDNPMDLGDTIFSSKPIIDSW
jgi:hypothetical protein